MRMIKDRATLLTNTWQSIRYEAGRQTPGIKALERLRDGQCAVIVIKHLLPLEDVAAAKWRIGKYKARASITNYSNGTLTTIGPYLAKHLQKPEAYFADAAFTDVLFPYVVSDLRHSLRQKLVNFFDLNSLEVLREDSERNYAPAIVRLHADGVSNPLHNDLIRRDASGTGLRVARLVTQFSCITCIQECSSGGALMHYNKQWEPGDERFKIKGGLGYDPQVVQGCSSFRFKPQSGDVYLINPTYYHAIEEVVGQERITLGFFFGSFDKDLRTAVAWS